MQQSIRCKSRHPEDGHQCKRKAGHEKIKPTDENPRDVRKHTAYGKEW